MMIDFRVSLGGLSLDDIGETISWPEAYAYIVYLIETPGTYLHMKENGWDYPLSVADALQMDANEIAANYGREKNSKFETLYTRPNEKKPQVTVGTLVSYEEAEQLYGI